MHFKKLSINEKMTILISFFFVIFQINLSKLFAELVYAVLIYHFNSNANELMKWSIQNW